jgi:penicillin amidase
MKVAKFLFSFLITLALIYLLDNGWNVGGNPIPPLGRFLDPYHGFWQNIESKDHKMPKDLTITGLKAPVSIIFDSLMIPHIFASSDDDLYLAQGYITAMHRLWQMEFQTHAAAGRVSEIIAGDAILDYDRNQRRLGMVYGAKHALQQMEKDSVIKKVFESYTAGINQYIKSLRYKDLALEYKLLNYTPEPWTNLKCALLLKNMSQTLNIGDKDMEMTNALKLFGKTYTDLLYPDDEGVGEPIVNNPGGWKFSPPPMDSVPLAVPAEYIRREVVRVRKKVVADPTVGSNNWAVGGSKTETGSPILCNDPHLKLNLPSIWYVVQLHAPGVNVMGASLPGAPYVIIGFNDSIAWGITNAQRDVADWFKLTYQNSKREKYLLDGEWINTEKVIEEFKIKGKENFYDTVCYTQWGPVTYDKNFNGENNMSSYAFRWIAHDGSEEFTAFYKLNRAKNYAEYMKALDYFASPAQNIAFASVSGDIAIRVQGKFPVRRQFEGKFILDGSQSSQGWQKFIPNEQNVMQKNPERGFISSANQYPADNTYPYYITSTSYEAYRNRRINQVLNVSNKISVDDMMKLQNDNFNLKAAESLPYFLNQLDTTKLSPSETSAWQILKQWNYVNDPSSQGAPYYEAWWKALMPLLWDEMEREDTVLYRPTTFQTIKLLKEQPDLIFFDIQNTDAKENARDVIRKSFSQSVADIEKWKTQHGDNVMWSDYKNSSINHLLPPMKSLSIPVKTGGNNDIVNAHSKSSGPSWRMIVSLEKTGVKAWGTYPGGQSGNPGSRFYNNLLDHWTKGQYYQLQFMHKAEAQPELHHSTTIINPE